MRSSVLLKFLLSYLKACFGIYAPVCCKIRITQNCNSNCKHCFRHLHRKADRELSTEEWKCAINKLIKSGSFLVIFVGGEPTLRQDLFEVALYARQKGAYTGLITNGQYPGIINEKIDHCFNVVTFSVDGLRQQHDYYRGEGSFVRSLNNIQVLLRMRKRVKVHASFVINDENYLCIPEYTAFCKTLGVDKIKFQPNFFPEYRVRDIRAFSGVIMETKNKYKNFIAGPVGYYRGMINFFQDHSAHQTCIHDDGFEIAVSSDGTLAQCSVPPNRYGVSPDFHAPYNILTCSYKDIRSKKLSYRICNGCYRLDCFMFKNIFKTNIFQGIKALIP